MMYAYSFLQRNSIDCCQNKVVDETLNELDWCLEQLEQMQTHRSVGEMATSKV
jgi:Phosphodiesterase 4 upstream conserved regions (UCR)